MRQPKELMKAVPTGFITAPPTPEQAMAIPIAKPFLSANQVVIMMGAGARKTKAAPKPRTPPAIYHW